MLFPQQPASVSPAIPPGNAEHGRYLVENVVHCVECHSSRDTQGHILPGTRYLGGPLPFSPPWPNDWATQVPRNKGLPGYTDQLAFRLFTQGSISRRGEVLRPPMPRFRMTPQDAADVIAYMRMAS
jgi:mono/diheme cytochrome c family protein